MHIEFAPVDAQFLKDCVRDGYYRSEAEAVRDAVRSARKVALDGRARLDAALRVGAESIAAGRVVPYTSTFLDEREQRARENIAAGIPPNPDVLP